MKVKQIFIAIGGTIVTILGIVVALLLREERQADIESQETKRKEKIIEKKVKKAEKVERKAQKAQEKVTKKATQTKRDLFKSHDEREDSMNDLVRKKD